ncbi:MAG: oxidoreductase [Litoreibacter sp.]|uniref:oxidoreductase n=1 Tax=Litoreibacter sp. TaxID=1969459 RepID=UPI00329759F5
MRKIYFLASLLVTLSGGVHADEPIATPSGDIVLTVSGDVTQTNFDNSIVLDVGLLSEMPSESFKTTTIWTETEHTFLGVPLAEFLNQFGGDVTLVKASAINDYTVEIPVDSITDTAPIIAYLMDEEPMSRRQKGPLWIVYPYDSDAKYRTEVVYSRSIWQLDRLELVR